MYYANEQVIAASLIYFDARLIYCLLAIFYHKWRLLLSRVSPRGTIVLQMQNGFI